MQRSTKIHIFILAALLLVASTAFALQVADTLATTAQGTPRVDLQEAFLTIGGIASLITLLTESVTKLLAGMKIDLSGWKARAASFIIAGVLTVIGVYGQIGLFANVIFQKYALWQVSIGGAVLLGLLSNGIFTIDVVQSLLTVLKLRVPGDTAPPSKG